MELKLEPGAGTSSYHNTIKSAVGSSLTFLLEQEVELKLEPGAGTSSYHNTIKIGLVCGFPRFSTAMNSLKSTSRPGGIERK